MFNFTFFPGSSGKPSNKTDILFLVSVLLLWGLGIFTLLVCTPDTAERLFGKKYYFVNRQIIWSILGLIGFCAFALLPISVIKKALPFFVLGTLFFCILALVPGIGSEKKGANRWVSISHFVSFQPSEFAKIAVVLFLANLFDKYSDSDYTQGENQKNFLYPLIGLLIFVLVIFLQKDFSTGVFVFVVGCIMFFVSGVKMTWFGPLIILAIPATILMIAIEPYRLMRVAAFFHPEEFTMTSGYQQFASKRAIISGGIWGNGLGSGLTAVSNIPEVQTDYIFAGWASAMGLLGVTAYFLVLILFAARGFRIAVTSKNRFAAYGAFGCTTMIFLQSLMNIAVVCGALPTTGIPQPFFSSGGSSLLATFCMCGFILNASSATAENEWEEYDSSKNMDFSKKDGEFIKYE